MTVTLSPRSVLNITDDKMTQDPSKSLFKAICFWCSTNWRLILSEVMATTLLVAFGCMSCLPLEGFATQPPLYAPLGFGFAVSFNIQIFGHISGAHMNPAVTLASVISGYMSISLGVAYAIAQCVGAILGYGILVGVAPFDLADLGTCLTVPHAGLTVVQAIGVEVVLTAALSIINCACWDPANSHKQDSTPIKFALAIAGLSIAGGPLTGASMNPARSLGPAVWTGGWNSHWIYWVGPFVGSAITAYMYKFIWVKKED